MLSPKTVNFIAVPLVGEFGKLASYLRVDDKKIVEYLASDYLNKIWTTNGIYDYDFQALTADLKGNWFSANSCRPLVGWHDELRVEFLLKILQAELSDEAVRRRGGNEPNVLVDHGQSHDGPSGSGVPPRFVA